MAIPPEADILPDPNNAMDVGVSSLRDEEGRNFESTEMELFDEICAEIYGHHDQVTKSDAFGPVEESVDAPAPAPLRYDSLHDIAEICEEEEDQKSLFLTPELPALLPRTHSEEVVNLVVRDFISR